MSRTRPPLPTKRSAAKCCSIHATHAASKLVTKPVNCTTIPSPTPTVATTAPALRGLRTRFPTASRMDAEREPRKRRRVVAPTSATTAGAANAPLRYTIACVAMMSRTSATKPIRAGAAAMATHVAAANSIAGINR